MRMLSDIRGEDALDVLADVMDPLVDIFSDPEVEKAYRVGRKVDVAKVMIKNHKRSVLDIMAILDEAERSEYMPTLVEIPSKLLRILNDPELAPFFQLQGQSQEDASSGSATGNTEATEKE